MDTLSCIAELKPTMMRSKDNRHEIAKSAAQFSLMIIIKKEYRILGLITFRTTTSNPYTKTRITRHLINKMASTQVGKKSKLR